MIKQAGQKEAIRLAVDNLKTIDLNYRCRLLGLDTAEDGSIRLRMFGKDYILFIDDLRLLMADSNKDAKMIDHVLLLRYLSCDVPVIVNNEFISLRDLPGGLFYWDSFISRTTQPLCRAIGNNIDRLKVNLNMFDYKEVDLTDFAVCIHTVGKIEVTLVYTLGDEELPPFANLLFDSCIKRPYSTEDVVVLSSRLCMDLMR